MISSGTKRGLAIAAVSALAVTGLGGLTSPAVANPASGQSGGVDRVVLVTPGEFNATDVISTRNGGTDTTYRLQAVGGGNVDRVRFQYRIGGGARVTIATVDRNDDGYFAFDWDADGLDGEDNLNVIAVALSGGGTVLFEDNFVTSVDDTAPTSDLAEGGALGVFRQPYAGEGATAEQVRMQGTSSRAGGTTVRGYVWNGASQAFVNPPQNGNGITTGGASGSSFDFRFDISGNYSYQGADQILLGVDNGAGGTGDAEGYALYEQVITQVTATPASSQVPTGGTQTVTVTVTDQNGAPISGAQVLTSEPGDPMQPQYTEADGEVTFQQPAGDRTYYANATDADPYNPTQGDKQSGTVTVTQYSPVTTSLDPDSNDGLAFDFDEYSSGDITVQVLDQEDNELDTTGQILNSSWTITPFNGSPTFTQPNPPNPNENGGEFTVPFPAGQPAGTYVLRGSLTPGANGQPAIPSSVLLTVKAGESALQFNNPNPDQAVIGSSKVVTGDLTLSDGTALPGRSVQVNDNSTGNGGIVQANGTIAGSRTVTTGADGGFSVTVKDPATPATEHDENISANTVPGTNDNDNPGAAQINTLVRFVTFVATPSIDINEVGFVQDTPGLLQTYRVDVRDGLGTPQAGVEVELSLDHGYFTNGNPSPAPVEGADAGTFASQGTSITRTTDNSGQVTVQVAIGRDAGFDDDGLVTAELAATSLGATETENIDWDSSNPLNGGEVSISRAAASEQEVTVLPKAPTNEQVAYDLFATDQFGNLTSSTVTVDSNLGDADVNGSGDSAQVSAQFEDDSPAVTTQAGQAGDETLTATWRTRTYKYDGNPLQPTFSNPPNGETLTDSGEVTNWYEIDFTRSRYTLTRDTAASVPAGSTVIETYRVVDQNGEPVSGVRVDFFRTGPDLLQNGTPATTSQSATTNDAGTAQYVFSGTTAGTAQIVAIIARTFGADGQPDRAVSESRATDAVTFTGTPTTPNPNPTPTTPTPVQAAIDAAVNGSSKGKKDKISVDAPAVANGAKVTLYKRIKGELVELKVKVLNGSGDIRFGVRDRNGKKVTKYVVVVDQTADSLADRSKTRIK